MILTGPTREMHPDTTVRGSLCRLLRQRYDILHRVKAVGDAFLACFDIDTGFHVGLGAH